MYLSTNIGLSTAGKGVSSRREDLSSSVLSSTRRFPPDVFSPFLKEVGLPKASISKFVVNFAFFELDIDTLPVCFLFDLAESIFGFWPSLGP